MQSLACAAFLLGSLFAPCADAQDFLTGTTQGSSELQPWLIGLAAVVGFLFVIFVANLANRLFCSKNKLNEVDGEMEKRFELGPSSNVYDNVAMEPEEGSSSAEKVEEEKLTSM